MNKTTAAATNVRKLEGPGTKPIQQHTFCYRYETVFAAFSWVFYFVTGLLTPYQIWCATAAYEAFSLKDWRNFDGATKVHHVLTNLGGPLIVYSLTVGGQPDWFDNWAEVQTLIGMSNLWLNIWQCEGNGATWVKLLYAGSFFYGRLFRALPVHVTSLRTLIASPVQPTPVLMLVMGFMTAFHALNVFWGALILRAMWRAAVGAPRRKAKDS